MSKSFKSILRGAIVGVTVGILGIIISHIIYGKTVGVFYFPFVISFVVTINIMLAYIKEVNTFIEDHKLPLLMTLWIILNIIWFFAPIPFIFKFLIDGFIIGYCVCLIIRLRAMRKYLNKTQNIWDEVHTLMNNEPTEKQLKVVREKLKVIDFRMDILKEIGI